MYLGDPIVHLQRFLKRRPGSFYGIVRRCPAENSRRQIAGGDADPRQGITGVEPKRLLKVHLGLGVSVQREFTKQMPALQIQVVSFDVVRLTLPCRAGQLHFQRVYNRPRDLVLDGEDIGHFAIVALTPELESR